MLFMLKEPTGIATSFLETRHKSRDNPATDATALRTRPHADHDGINISGKKRYTSRHV
ncbi:MULTISPECIES: hypothetical protein [Erwinia]|jgi:hypothetical protein|uniref:hypothetical protein n=1 Tax=Erwinia TaxID=551 RepID=UPI0012FF365A|nr:MULTISPECIES: hypothetical protein [Erwinia]